MSDMKNCPFCAEPLKADNLYVRGIAAALLRSERADVGALSRSELEQIDLRNISRGRVGAQAIIPSLYCEACGGICFMSR